MNNVIQRIFASEYEGVISESGLGVPLQAEILSYPGASNVVLMGLCPYNAAFQPKINGRSVSEQMVVKMADAAFTRAKANGFPRAGKKLFSVAISGTYANEKIKGAQSHAWMCVITDQNIFITHIVPTYVTGRKTTIKEAGKLAIQILGAALLDDISLISDPLLGFGIDVIRWPQMSTSKKIEICLRSNVPVYFDEKGYMQRPTDIIRKAKQIYRGSFNPVTNTHIEIGKDALFEICRHNFYKDPPSDDDLTHRINMLNLVNKGVLITACNETFYRFSQNLKLQYNVTDIEYIAGADVFNAICQHALANTSIIKDMQTLKFKVYNRNNLELHDFAKTMQVDIINGHNDFSSTQARNGDHSGLDPKVSDYIRKNNLY